MAYTEFFVTKGSAASDVNGGGPSLGTNDGPVYTSADVDSDGAGTTLTDNSGSDWAGITVGDWLCFDTAGAKEFCRIVTNPTATTVTVTPAVSTSASTKTVNVGGAWATPDHACDTVTTSFVNAAGDPPRINLKYNATAYAKVKPGGSGSTTVRLRIEGYETTPGDYCPNKNLPIIEDTVGGNVAAFDMVGIHYWDAVCLHLKTAMSGDRAYYSSGSNNHLIRVVGESNLDTFEQASGAGNKFIGCWSKSTGSGRHGFKLGGWSWLQGCISSDAGSCGFYTAAPYETTFTHCIADNAGDDGFHIAGECFQIEGCVAYSCGGSGIRLVDTTDVPVASIRNCILTENTVNGIEFASAAQAKNAVLAYNAFGNNGGDGWSDWSSSYSHTPNIEDDQGDGADVELTASPFTDAATRDFTLNATAGAGAACKDAGFDAGDNIGHG